MQKQLSLPFSNIFRDEGLGKPQQAPAKTLTTITDDELSGATLREECGVFGVFGHRDAAALTVLGLHALQHRGHEAAGIVPFDGAPFQSERGLESVGVHFTSAEIGSGDWWERDRKAV